MSGEPGTERAEHRSGALVFGDQKAVLAEAGIEFRDDAPLRPLLTIGGPSKRTLIVVLTEPDEGPAVDVIGPWIETSSDLIDHMERRQ